MKEKNCASETIGVRTKYLARLAGAAMLAVILAGTAPAQVNLPVKPGVGLRPGTPPALLNGNLVKIPVHPIALKPNLLQVQGKPPIAFKAFELKDPKTDKSIAPTALITLPNGKQVPAQQYYNELNTYEKWLNEHGHSLRTTPKGAQIKLQEIPVDRGMFQRQLQSAPKPAPVARRANLLALNSYRSLSTPQSIQLKAGDAPLNQAVAPGFNRGAMVAPSAQPTESKSAPPQAISKTPSKPGVQESKLAQPAVGIKPPTPNMGMASAENLTGVKRDGMVISTAALAQLAALRSGVKFAPGLVAQCTPVNESRNWDWNVGDPNTFAAYVNGSISLTGNACKPADMAHFDNNQSKFTVTAEGRAGGTIFGVGGDLLRITGNIGGDQGNHTVTTGLGIYALGMSVYSVNRTDNGHWGVDNTISKDLDFSTNTTIPVGPFSVNTVVGAHGSVGFQYSILLYPTNISISGGPFSHTTVYAQASLNLLVAEVGVGVNMNLMDWSMTLHGMAGIAWNNQFYVQQEIYADGRLHMLNGNLYVFAKVYYPCFDPWPDICNSQWNTDLWTSDGIQFDGVLFDVKNTTPLPW